MVIRYILKKKYPGFHELNLIHTFAGNNDEISTSKEWKGLNYYKNNPEFWEEVIEKNYKILSFKDNRGKIWKSDTQIKDCWCHKNGIAPFYQEKQLLKFRGFEIYSIERLSDGEIFTVGNKVNSTKYDKKVERTISKFNIGKNVYDLVNTELLVKFDKETTYCYCFKLNEISNIKQTVLFTTDDGVDIYEKDKYWVISKKFTNESISKYEYSIYNFIKRNIDTEQYNWDNFWRFSTKEKAQEYIDTNYVKVEDGWLNSDQIAFSVHSKQWYEYRSIFNQVKQNVEANYRKHFVTKEAREEYIEENKLIYSKMDMIKFANFANHEFMDYINSESLND